MKNYRNKINNMLAVRDDKISSADMKDDELCELVVKLKQSEEALHILQHVSKETQSMLEYRISELVTLALASVFDNPYEFKIKYETKRNKTEASLWFVREGEYVHPLDAAGGGVVDVASFALRVTLWSIASPKTDNVIVLDEPFKMLSQDLQYKAGKMLKEISDKLGLQFIMVSHVEDLIGEADRVFKVTQKKGISKVEVVI